MIRVNEKIRSILKAPYIRSIAILSGGSLIAQVVNFGFSMVMTRQYSQDSIGYFTYVLSIVSMFSTVINGRYDVSIVSAETKHETFSLIKLSFWISLFLSIAVSIVSVIYITNTHKEYASYTFLSTFIFPLLLINGLINILNAYNNKYGEYKLISSAYLIRTIWQSVLTTIAGFFTATPFSLLASQLVGQFFGIKRQSKRLITEKAELKQIKTPDMKKVLIKHKKQPLFSAPATFINAVSYSLISLFVGDFFSMSTLAIYSISVRVLGLPLSVFSANISKVHYKEAETDLKNTGCFRKSTKKMLSFSLLIAVAMLAVLMLFAPNLFAVFYGSSWRESGVYVQILAPMFALRMMVGAVGYSFIISGKQKTELIFQIILLASLVIIAALYKTFLFDIKVFLIILSAVYSVIYLSELITIIFYARKKRENTI